jgi:hypothetical protein
MRMPLRSTAICAEPSTWPAGWKLTPTPSPSKISSPRRHRLLVPAKSVAIADAHDVERLARCQHLGMAGAGVVGMAMGDQRALDRPHRIDIEIA